MFQHTVHVILERRFIRLTLVTPVFLGNEWSVRPQN